MPRRPREISESGFYHVIQRGNAHCLIFESDDDRKRMLMLLRRLSVECGFKVVCWCLMDDHVHLIIDALESDFSAAMRDLFRRYAVYFNQEHERDGRLFQGRFQSKPIMDDAQLMATIHYIHQNPAAAGICTAEKYRWSSLQECLGKHYLIDSSFVLELFDGIDGLLAYQDDPEHVVLPYSGNRGMTDQDAVDLACDLLGDDALRKLQSCGRAERDRSIRALAHCGVPMSQIARLASVGIGTVRSLLR